MSSLEPGGGLGGPGPGRGLLEDSGSFLVVVVDLGRGLMGDSGSFLVVDLGRGLVVEPGRCPSSSDPARTAAPVSCTVHYPFF